ncbi:LANO_0H12882g1_1 [Lachancea nothofagi CBS 11611]|uniref:LANO_0H12882g1_1 n=1 Tax=Lachancea nothofagi CBS 11611 TaxID=1266666 RepID=A0A1G4KM90_9SACH|nr:LANO_0H12882g1_1 [Lachancea nothofagi CBS 11611]
MAASASYFSKIDANLQDFKSFAKAGNSVDLYLNSRSKSLKVKNTLGDYSNTLKLANEEYICYQFSHEYSVLALYSLGNAFAGRTLKVHLPERMLNMHHTFTIREVKNELAIEMILKDGLYLVLAFPVNCILDMTSAVPENWFRVLNPYDFTIRQPQYAYSASETFTIVFLEDGGLLGLRKIKNDQGEPDVTPTLFNDNSYLQSLSKLFFSNRHTSQHNNVVSCTLYRERFLITLTQGCRLKIWDLEKQTVIFEKHLAADDKNLNRVYETLGQFLSVCEDKLAIFLPFENGLFQLWDLRLDNQGDLVIDASSIYASNLSSSSIWSLVDMKLIKPIDILESASYLNIVVLWRSNRVMKLQVLNLLSDDLKKYQWLEATNQSLMDLRADLNLLTNGDTNRALMNLKSHYTPELFQQAQEVLSENGILMLPESPYNHEYLLNLESVLKDMKKRNDEPSSLTLYHNELLLVNSLSLYSHSLYKANSTLETCFYNMSENVVSCDDLGGFLRTIEGFAATIPTQVLTDVSDSLLDVVTSSFPADIPIKDKFTNIFSKHLEGQFHLANLRKLFDDLSSFDVVAILDNFIKSTLQSADLDHSLIDSVYPNYLMNVAVLESTHQAILIHNNLVSKVLLIFAFMDFDYSAFRLQIETLLGLHYKQSLWIHLYQLDKGLLASELFATTSKFGNGHKIETYADWSSALTVSLKVLYGMPISPNPLFIESFDTFVISGTRSSKLCELYLKNIQQKFYIHSNVAHEFMLGLTYFMSGFYDRAFDFLQKHPYPDTLPQELPDSLYMPLQKDGHLWRDVIGSFKLPNKHPAYYFNLSKLFSVANSYEYALRCAKKSIKLSTELEDVEETHEFKNAQLLQYLNILIVFSKYEEILDVLCCSPEIISEHVKVSYYRKMISNLHHRDAFFSTLLKICKESSGLYLPTQDYRLIDKILCDEIAAEDWCTYKRVYAFRLMNAQDRAAAEILYKYFMKGTDIGIKEKCYLMIANILTSFSAENDRWILADGQLVTLQDLKREMNNL